MKNNFFIFLLSLIPIFSFAQEKQISDQFITLTTYGGSHKVADGLKLHTLVGVWREDFLKNDALFLIRLGLDKSVAKNVALGFGFDRLVVSPYGEQPIAKTKVELRTYERLIFSQRAAKFAFKQRFQLEQRYANKTTQSRLRYRFTASHPITNKLSVVAFDEVFIHLGERHYGKNFNQNWAYLGLKYKIGKGNISLGYLNQFLVKGDRIRAEQNHTLSIGYGYNFDFTSKY